MVGVLRNSHLAEQHLASDVLQSIHCAVNYLILNIFYIGKKTSTCPSCFTLLRQSPILNIVGVWKGTNKLLQLFQYLDTKKHMHWAHNEPHPKKVFFEIMTSFNKSFYIDHKIIRYRRMQHRGAINGWNGWISGQGEVRSTYGADKILSLLAFQYLCW